MVGEFKDKKVLVMGLGLHGGAVAVVEWLLKNKAEITITDIKTKIQLKKSLDRINKHFRARKIKYILGRHDLKDFTGQDLIIQNPGVPKDSKFLNKARRANIPIVNEAVLFFGLYPGRSIGITGTRGKSSTATLLHKILKTEIKSNVVAGNIATNPMLSAITKLKVKSLPVLELSSWHLEGLDDYKVSPHIALVTNVLNDHLNRYKNFTEYKNAKAAIVRHQIKNDIAVLNFDNPITKKFYKETQAKTYFYSLGKKVKGAYLKGNTIYFYNGKRVSEVMKIGKIKVLGQHNLSNILAAVTVAKVVGIKDRNIAKAVNRFKGIEYRLEYKGNIKNVAVYNDATSTTPDASLAAIEALQKKQVILIAGGEDKQLDYKKLAKKIKAKVNFVVLLSGSGSKKLKKELLTIKYPQNKLISDVNQLSKAWKIALENIDQNDCILFSPAAASFNMFINEFDRAKQFDKLFYGGQKKKK
ncbi:UDP-N-acetylmuramoyl-L-alanine--D-glutamate ligase [bacterium]|nr:UDP-N-acetylmuramoyl-L-alanine--D-glutamate ligase [bacterium]